MERKILVPEGMLKAAMDWAVTNHVHGMVVVGGVVEAALRWLSENPIVPSEAEMAKIMAYWREGHPENFYIYCSVEWQRRMFLAPELEVPEEFNKAVIFILDEVSRRETAPSNAVPKLFKAFEAYRRGQKAKM